jgi:hypothetical protein
LKYNKFPDQSFEEDIMDMRAFRMASNISPEISDSILRLEQVEAGSKARAEGLPRSACPWKESLVSVWWYKGYDHPHHSIPEIPYGFVRSK